MKEFGRQEYEDVAYINFDHNSKMEELFSSDLNIERLIMGMEIYIGKKIDPQKTLLIFDEVQEVPKALTSLKYFYENAIEVKAEENLRAKSLRAYYEKYQPELAVRTSMSDYRRQDWLLNLPLYAIEAFPG